MHITLFFLAHPPTHTHAQTPTQWLIYEIKASLGTVSVFSSVVCRLRSNLKRCWKCQKKRKPHIIHLSGLQIHWLVFISNSLFSRILKCLYFLFAACCSTAHPHPSKSASRPHPTLPGGCNAAWKCEHTLAPSKNPLRYSFKGPMHLARRQIISSNSILPHGIFQ